jgi:hypothetical protein
MNRIKLFFKSLFKKQPLKNPKKRGLTKKGLQIYSFDPKSGEVRCETGVWYVETNSLRAAQRKFKRMIEEATKRKVTVSKQ